MNDFLEGASAFTQLMETKIYTQISLRQYYLVQL